MDLKAYLTEQLYRPKVVCISHSLAMGPEASSYIDLGLFAPLSREQGGLDYV